jgi:hypothetical protein
MEKKKKEIDQLQLKVLQLYDEFTQFSYQCAFLCDSFSTISAQPELIEPETIDGIQHYSRWLKTRTLEIKSELKKVHKQLKKIKHVET